MVSCAQAGLYIQGPNSAPVILHNVFMVCKSPSITRKDFEKLNDKKHETAAIITTDQVDAFIALNEMQINDTGIQIINNDSIVFENII